MVCPTSTSGTMFPTYLNVALHFFCALRHDEQNFTACSLGEFPETMQLLIAICALIDKKAALD